GFCSSVKVNSVFRRSICCSTEGAPRLPSPGALPSLSFSWATSEPLERTRPLSASAAITLILVTFMRSPCLCFFWFLDRPQLTGPFVIFDIRQDARPLLWVTHHSRPKSAVHKMPRASSPNPLLQRRKGRRDWRRFSLSCSGGGSWGEGGHFQRDVSLSL